MKKRSDMTDLEAAVTENIFPESVWGRVVMERVEDDDSPYSHAFYFLDVPVEAHLSREERRNDNRE
jgi:hypothetical protein